MWSTSSKSKDTGISSKNTSRTLQHFQHIFVPENSTTSSSYAPSHVHMHINACTLIYSTSLSNTFA